MNQHGHCDIRAALVVTRLDRLGRSSRDLTNIAEEIEICKAALRALPKPARGKLNLLGKKPV
jgi:DNA invertase Pin-like site-specific DNA recombinase